ncbi:thioredoxin [Defluviitalea phaphyphila]|uniref:thioredoxin n=1 Tax=Defluviitalea phaphyphila TaxID=1473580 RepID=UPI0007318935|nr:thioredoxin [Defluviitalea phaphyphila]
MAMQFTDSNFEKEVLEYKGTVLVDFFAVWCGPCKMMSPIIDELSTKYEGKVKIGKLNVDEEPSTAAKYGIMSIPTIMIFKDGKVVDKVVGALPKQELENRLSKWM